MESMVDPSFIDQDQFWRVHSVHVYILRWLIAYDAVVLQSAPARS